MRYRGLHRLFLWALLFGFWYALSGMADAVHLSMGAVCATFVVWLSGDLWYDQVGSERRSLVLLPWGRVLKYWFYLGVEIVKANWHVLRLVLAPRGKLAPRLVTARCGLRSELGKVVYANSITLTPGTITLDILPDGVFVVHSLDAPSAGSIEDGSMERHVADTFESGVARG